MVINDIATVLCFVIFDNQKTKPLKILLKLKNQIIPKIYSEHTTSLSFGQKQWSLTTCISCIISTLKYYPLFANGKLCTAVHAHVICTVIHVNQTTWRPLVFFFVVLQHYFHNLFSVLVIGFRWEWNNNSSLLQGMKINQHICDKITKDHTK